MEKQGVIDDRTPDDAAECRSGRCKCRRPPVKEGAAAADDPKSHPTTRVADAASDAAKGE